uniref:Lipase_3 domain-containing protein n=1 Tax=Rhabditophanes sp. KR3021 TaxID=114890 RepID=A0AC35TPD3_9BILA
MLFLKAFTLLALFATASADYSDFVARNILWPMCAASYSNHPENCIANRLPNTKLIKQITVPCDSAKSDDCSGFIAVDSKEKAILVIFRGTEGFVQLLQEGTSEIFTAPVKFLGGGVSPYFFNAFNQVWFGGLKDVFLTVRNTNPTFKVWVTGHSLGGSMANIAAATIASNGYAAAANMLLVTMGEPRTGNAAFVKAYDALNIESYRITHKHDLVPHLPPKLVNLYGYEHHKTEVFYDDDMTPGADFKVCVGDDSDKCSSASLLDVSINDHLHYFNVQVLDYAASGCVSK